MGMDRGAHPGRCAPRRPIPVGKRLSGTSVRIIVGLVYRFDYGDVRSSCEPQKFLAENNIDSKRFPPGSRYRYSSWIRFD